MVERLLDPLGVAFYLGTSFWPSDKESLVAALLFGTNFRYLRNGLFSSIVLARALAVIGGEMISKGGNESAFCVSKPRRQVFRRDDTRTGGRQNKAAARPAGGWVEARGPLGSPVPPTGPARDRGSGIIIDTFAELRDTKQKVEEDSKKRCFICGIEAYTFDRFVEGGFTAHTKVGGGVRFAVDSEKHHREGRGRIGRLG